MLRRLRQRRLEEEELSKARAPEMEEPVLGSVAERSPRGQPRSPRSAGSGWPIHQSTAPSVHEDATGQPKSAKATSPQELPGSMFIHQHDPAFQGDGGSELEGQRQVSPPTSPPKTPARSLGYKSNATRSIPTGKDGLPVVSPVSPPMS